MVVVSYVSYILKPVVYDFHIRKSYPPFTVVGHTRDVNNMLCMSLVILGLFGVNHSVSPALRLPPMFWCNVYQIKNYIMFIFILIVIFPMRT